jgi:hypothetical protein
MSSGSADAWRDKTLQLLVQQAAAERTFADALSAQRRDLAAAASEQLAAAAATHRTELAAAVAAHHAQLDSALATQQTAFGRQLAAAQRELVGSAARCARWQTFFRPTNRYLFLKRMEATLSAKWDLATTSLAAMQDRLAHVARRASSVAEIREIVARTRASDQHAALFARLRTEVQQLEEEKAALLASAQAQANTHDAALAAAHEASASDSTHLRQSNKKTDFACQPKWSAPVAAWPSQLRAICCTLRQQN